MANNLKVNEHNDMKELKADIISFAKKSMVDMIGFASRDCFEKQDPRHNPLSIFPEAQTVILIGRRITRGTLRGVEEGTNFADYSNFGYSWLDNEFVAQSCYDIVSFIEDRGWEAVPVFPNPMEVYGQGVSVRLGNPAPNVTPDFNYAAVACGLGEIGMNDEFLTGKFGTRQRFQMIITDARIEPDPVMEGKICDRCGKCADICPLGAINKTEFKEINICGKIMKVAKIDYSLCKICKNGALPNRLHSPSKPDRIAALCNRTCVCHLEEEKLIDNVFENTFRKRTAWGKDVLGKSVETGRRSGRQETNN